MNRYDPSASAPTSQALSQLPESLVDYAANAIRKALVLGQLTPGDRVSPEIVAARLGISHIPVREALRILQAEGHLVRDDNRGVRVAPVSAEEAGDIFRTRALLEREANSLGIPRLTDDDIVKLERLVDGLEAAARAGDVLTYRRLNRAFHFIPFERSGRPWLVRFLNNLWDGALRYQSPLYATGAWQSEHGAHQRSLLAALTARDVEAANEVMKDHRRWLLSAEVEEPTQPEGRPPRVSPSGPAPDGDGGPAALATVEGPLGGRRAQPHNGRNGAHGPAGERHRRLDAAPSGNGQADGTHSTVVARGQSRQSPRGPR